MTPLIAIAVAVAITVIGGACGIGDRQRQGRVIRSSLAKLAAKGTATVTEARQLKVIDSGGQGESGLALSLPKGRTTPVIASKVAIDYPRELALATLPPTDSRQPPVPFQYFSEGAFYQRRLKASGTGRQWLKLDFHGLYDDRKNKADAAFANDFFNPTWIVGLLKGALSGSVKTVGQEEIDGIRTTHYKVNFDWDKSFSGMSTSRRQSAEAALQIMGVPRRVVRGEVWLDGDGLPRRLMAKIRQVKDRHDVVEWQFSLDLSAIGQPVSIALPPTKDISAVDTIGSIAQAVTALGPQAAAGTAAP